MNRKKLGCELSQKQSKQKGTKVHKTGAAGKPSKQGGQWPS